MKKSLCSLALVFSSILVVGQTNDPVVMSINGKDVKKSEFEYIYNKNNNENAMDKRTLDEYVVLFKNFKLRVAEAEAQGMDTTASFHKELNEYRSQLARPYLAVEEMDESLLKQAYDRSQVYSEVSGIFILYSQIKNGTSYTVTPADTLALYNKMVEIRKLATKKGADFSQLVIEYSDDEQSKKSERPGYFGWFSSFGLLPSLEKPIYETPNGEISMPIRTPQGYYLLKIHDKKSNPGEVHAAHILIACPLDADTVQIADAEKKIKEVEQKLKEGVDFLEVAKEYSDDPSVASNGGDLSWFPYGRMLPEFNDKVFSMAVGSISEPVRTKVGYHIIKLIEKKENGPSFEDLKAEIKTKFERTGGYFDLYKPAIDQLKDSLNYSANQVVYGKLKEATNLLVPTDSVFIDKFQQDKEVLFTINNQSYTVADFIDYLKKDNSRSFFNFSAEMLQDKYNQFVQAKLIETEDKALESKYPEFKNLMQEYRDGILLFEVSNKEVWEKASTDTIGLAEFFKKNQSKYAWDEPHWKGYVILAKDSDVKKKMQKEIAKMNPEEAVKYLLENYKVGDVSYVKIDKGLFTKGQNAFVDEEIFKTGKAERPEDYTDFFLLGKLLKDNMPEVYTDVRGMVITNYQDYLEQEWLQYLNKKYPVTIYQDVIDTLK